MVEGFYRTSSGFITQLIVSIILGLEVPLFVLRKTLELTGASRPGFLKREGKVFGAGLDRP